MIINRLIKIVLVILSVAFIILRVVKEEFYADLSSAVLLLLITTLYVRENGVKFKFLFYFLVCFSIGKCLELSTNFFNFEVNDISYDYYIANCLFILAYVFLILRCTVSMTFVVIIKKFPVTLIILILLGVFCVTLITETAQTQLSNTQFYLEFIYNTIIMVLLSIALINYMDKSDNKSMLFFVGTMFIFFSEMIQLAYYYVAEMPHLAAMYTIFLVLAFMFLYIQSRLKHQVFDNEMLYKTIK